MKKSALLLSVVLATFAHSTSAQEVGGTAVSLGLSSVGVTGQIGYRFSEKWRVRGMVSGAPSYRSGEDLGNISYETTTRLRGVSVFADRTLWNSIWRLSFGAFVSGSEATGRAQGNLQIGDNVYSTSVDAAVEFNNTVSPILALGFDVPMKGNWHFSGSAGYIYTGGVNVSLIGGPGILPGDLIKEKLKAEADVDDGYPFIEIGFYYTF